MFSRKFVVRPGQLRHLFHLFIVVQMADYFLAVGHFTHLYVAVLPRPSSGRNRPFLFWAKMELFGNSEKKETLPGGNAAAVQPLAVIRTCSSRPAAAIAQNGQGHPVAEVAVNHGPRRGT